MPHFPVISPKLPEKIQDLPPKWAHFALHTAKFVEDELGVQLTGKGVLVAVSGGADSLCLLILLKTLQERLNLRLQVCHLDHGLRPSSAHEACWVGEVCKKLGLPYHMRKVDIAKLVTGATGEIEASKETLATSLVNPPTHKAQALETGQTVDVREETAKAAVKGLENTGREARYALFEQVRKAENLDYIATAHSLNDLAEDICMRLLRGCGWPELGGMTGFDPKRFLIRPLLMQPRFKLEEMLADCELTYLNDESNESMDYLRNRVRKQIVPVFAAENSGFLDHCRNLWSLARDDHEFWEHYLQQIDEKLIIKHNSTKKCELILPFSAFLKEDKAVRLRLYRYCLEKLAQNAYNTQNIHNCQASNSNRLENGCKPELNSKIVQQVPSIFTSAHQVKELDNAVWRRIEGSGSGQMNIQFSGGARAKVAKAEIIFTLL